MDVTDLNLKHLRLLTHCVREGSLSGAAGKAGVTQSAVSQAIARLETLTGTTLLERSKAGAQPTDGGILLAARAEAAGNAMTSAFRPFRQGGSGGRAGADADVTMAQLQAMTALDEGGSYVAASTLAGVSEPSLHRAIGDLERLAGIALVERAGRGVAVTEAGKRMAAAFRVARAELRAALDELAVLSGRDQGHIRIAATPSALATLLPRAITRFLVEHPPVHFDISEASDADATLEALRSGRVDFALLPASPRPPVGLHQETVFDDHLQIVARDGHPLEDGPAPGAMRLAAFKWVLPPEGTPERDAWRKLFLDGGLYPPEVGIDCGPLATRLALVADSDMLTMLSPHLVPPGLVAVGDPVPTSVNRLALLTRAGWFPSPAQAAFVEELRGSGESVVQF